MRPAGSGGSGSGCGGGGGRTGVRSGEGGHTRDLQTKRTRRDKVGVEGREHRGQRRRNKSMVITMEETHMNSHTKVGGSRTALYVCMCMCVLEQWRYRHFFPENTNNCPVKCHN